MVASLKEESLASLTRIRIDCVRRADNVCCCNDIEVIKQLIHDIDSVIEKISSLCKSKDMHIMFNEMSHFANVTSEKLNHRLSYVRSVSDLDQRLFKTRKKLCDMIIEVQPACKGNDPTLINNFISNIELVSDLMQRSFDTLIKTHCKNIAFNTIFEIKSMYQPFITKHAPFALQCLMIELGTLESSPSESDDKLTVDSCADSEKAESIKYSKA